MRFEQLQCLVEAVESGSMRGAADHLFMTPQAVSAAIRQLEEELGKELLIRSKNGIQLTPDGEEALSLAKDVITARNHFLEVMSSHSREGQDAFPYLLRIGSSSSAINHFLPGVLKKMNRRDNQLSIQLENAEQLSELLERTMNGYYGLALVSVNEEELTDIFHSFEDTLTLIPLVQDEMVVVTDRKYVREGQTTISREEYRSRPSTTFNILVREDNWMISRRNMAVSNDVDFHREMIDKMGANVTMPGLAQQIYFSSKKYATLELLDVPNPIVHCAIVRKAELQQLTQVIQLIQKELHTK